MGTVVIDYLVLKIVISVFQLGEMWLKGGDLLPTLVAGGIPILVFSVN